MARVTEMATRNSQPVKAFVDPGIEPRGPSRPMRILFTSLDAPFPVTSGRRLRNWALLQALAEEGHLVTLVYFDEPGQSIEVPFELKRLCKHIEVVPHPEGSGGSRLMYWNRFRALFSPLPYGAWRLRSPLFRRRIQESLTRESFDFLVCDEIFMAANIPVRPAVPIILNKMGISAVLFERFLATEKNLVKKVYAKMELRKTCRWETLVSTRSALIMACSEQDRSEMAHMTPGVKIDVVPNVIDLKEYEPAPHVNTRNVVFVGYLSWYPNQDAVEFFVSSVLPKLRSLVPDVQFVAAGRNPPDEFRQRLSKVAGVKFTGTVPDIRPVIASAAVCVVPLRIAAGTRMKILEAAAMEKAVVSTTIGAEGLDFENGTEIVIADDPEMLACEIAALLDSPSRAHEIGVAARRRVQECYSIEAVRTALRRTVAEIRGRIDREPESVLTTAMRPEAVLRRRWDAESKRP